MALFKDAMGREWLVELDGPTMGSIRDQAKVDLADLSGNGYLKIETDAPSLVAVLQIICREAIAKAGLTAEQFGKQIRKDALKHAAAAVLDAAADFFPKKAWCETLSRLSTSRTMRTKLDGMKPMLAILDDPGIPERMKTAVMEAITEMIQAGGVNIDSPESEDVISAGGSVPMPSTPVTA